jgi:DNA-binding transcriptional ArsR family regulator
MLADELLARARRIIKLESEQEHVNKELAREKGEYADLIAKAVKGELQEAGVHRNDTRNGGSNGPIQGPLRDQILALLRGAPRPLSLDEIQGKVGEQRAKIMWTLANLKRAGLAENSRRGFWQRGKADVEEEANDPDDSPELSSF